MTLLCPTTAAPTQQLAVELPRMHTVVWVDHKRCPKTTPETTLVLHTPKRQKEALVSCRLTGLPIRALITLMLAWSQASNLYNIHKASYVAMPHNTSFTVDRLLPWLSTSGA